MRKVQYYLLIVLIKLLFQSPIVAQTPDKPLAEMSWLELTAKWQSLVEKDNNILALPYAQAALERALQDDPSENSIEYGNSLDNLGFSLHHTGQYAEAEKAFLAAVAHGRMQLGEDHEDFITRLSNLAMLHLDMNEVAKSTSELERAVYLAEKNLGPENPYVAIMVNNLALAYEKVGSLDLAFGYYKHALECMERSGGKGTARYATRMANVGSILRKMGKNEQALEYNLKAMELYEKTADKNQTEITKGMFGLLRSYMALGRFEAAQPLYDSLCVLMEKMPRKESAQVYDYTYTLTNFNFLTGNYQKCIDLCQVAIPKYLALFPRLYGRHVLMCRIASTSLEKTGKLKEATDYTLLANRLSLDDLRENFGKFSEDEQFRYYQMYREGADSRSLLFALRHPEFQELAGASFNYEMMVKGLALSNRRQLFQSLRENTDAKLSVQFMEWQRLQNNISSEYALTPAKRLSNLDSLLVRSNELERNLVLASETFSLASQSARWQDVQTALSPGEAAIEFGQLKSPSTDSVLYVAWVLRPGDQAPQQVFLFEEKEIGVLTATRRLYSYDPSVEGKNLRELLWNPLEPLLKGISTLYFAPAGVLHQVNLAAIPVSVSEVLADRFQLHQLVSTRLVLTLKKAKAPLIPKSALVFGGIRYESDSLALLSTNLTQLNEPAQKFAYRNRGTVFGEDWDFLAGSLKESNDVRHRLEAIGTKVTFADGYKASEGFFKKSIQDIPAPELLHLATHGFFLSSPDTSAKTGFAAAENPMARAGLVLSGANRVWSGAPPLSGQEDGILTALEISRQDLSHTKLAVLSACGTGQGKVEAGEGVLGLQRAFKMAGVQYVIMTLWNVQDQDAQQFMDLFYEQWLSGKKNVPDAFRVAQQKMRALHSKPFQPTAWAGFLLLE